jgi:hypothetical protein
LAETEETEETEAFTEVLAVVVLEAIQGQGVPEGPRPKGEWQVLREPEAEAAAVVKEITHIEGAEEVALAF